MRELRGIESYGSKEVEADPRSQFYIFPQDDFALEPDDEVLVLIDRESRSKEEAYGIALRITRKSQPDEDEFILQYGDRLLVAQKIPDFI